MISDQKLHNNETPETGTLIRGVIFSEYLFLVWGIVLSTQRICWAKSYGGDHSQKHFLYSLQLHKSISCVCVCARDFVLENTLVCLGKGKKVSFQFSVISQCLQLQFGSWQSFLSGLSGSVTTQNSLFVTARWGGFTDPAAQWETFFAWPHK